MKNSISTSEYKRLLGIDTPKKNKYGAVGVWACPKCHSNVMAKTGRCPLHVDLKPIYFHSTGEFQYWLDLILMQATGEIRSLERQPRYDLTVNNVHIGYYTADFRYVDKAGKEVVIDYKSKATNTDSSKLRRKLTYAIYGVEVTLVWNGR